MLRQLLQQGLTYEAIGRRLGISKNAVCGRVHRLGIGGERAVSPFDNEGMALRLIELRQQGVRNLDIADRLGVTFRQVEHAIQRLVAQGRLSWRARGQGMDAGKNRARGTLPWRCRRRRKKTWCPRMSRRRHQLGTATAAAGRYGVAGRSRK